MRRRCHRLCASVPAAVDGAGRSCRCDQDASPDDDLGGLHAHTKNRWTSEPAAHVALAPTTREGPGCVKTSSVGEWTRGRRRWDRRLPPYSISASHDKLTYVFIAWISVVVPKIFIALFKLYADTCRLISVLTRGNVLVRKCVEPIHAFNVPNECSTVCRRSRAACGVWSSRR